MLLRTYSTKKKRDRCQSSEVESEGGRRNKRNIRALRVRKKIYIREWGKDWNKKRRTKKKEIRQKKTATDPERGSQSGPARPNFPLQRTREEPVSLLLPPPARTTPVWWETIGPSDYHTPPEDRIQWAASGVYVCVLLRGSSLGEHT